MILSKCNLTVLIITINLFITPYAKNDGHVSQK